MESAYKGFKSVKAIAALSLLSSHLIVHAGGYESPVLWSAHFAPLGNAAVSSVIGAQSLYFNPAGLAYVEGLELSANLGVSSTKTESSLLSNSQNVAGSNSMGFPFALMMDYEATPEFGIGFGVYTAGQTRRVYENVNLAVINTNFDLLKPVMQSQLDLTEVAAGAGYQLGHGFSAGLALRALIVNGAISMVNFTTGSSTARAIDIQDLSAVKLVGLRLGAAYISEDRHWGFGVSGRTSMSFEAKGRANSRSEGNSAGSPIIDEGTLDATASSILPAQISFGAHVNASSAFRVVGQYDYTNWKKNNFIYFTGTAGGSAIPSLAQDWKDTHTGRVGFDYQVDPNWAIRTGYVYESEYVPFERSAGILGEPGPSHTLGFGAGTIVDRWSLDMAANYTFASGAVSVADSNIGTTQSLPSQTYVGNPKSATWVLHLGASHRF